MSSTATTRTRSAWWVLGLSVLAAGLTFVTAWALMIQLVMIVFTIRQLTQKPSKDDARLLIIALVVLVIAVAAIVASAIVLYGFSSTSEITSVPLGLS